MAKSETGNRSEHLFLLFPFKLVEDLAWRIIRHSDIMAVVLFMEEAERFEHLTRPLISLHPGDGLLILGSP